MDPQPPRRDRTHPVVERLKRAIVASVADKLRDEPEAFGRLVEMGLVDGGLLDGESIDLDAAIAQFRSRISELAATAPSVLQTLEMRPLDVMREAPRAPDSTDADVVRAVVFSDLEGFTAFTGERGDAEASALLRDHYAAVEALTRARGGRVIKKIGDGHMLVFPNAESAVMASLDLVEAGPDPLRLRSGSHLGSVIEADGDYFGGVVNLASRVTDVAEGGSALVTEAVRAAVAELPRVVFSESTKHRFPGIPEPVDVRMVVRN